jgi:hypothetical protein
MYIKVLKRGMPKKVPYSLEENNGVCAEIGDKYLT